MYFVANSQGDWSILNLIFSHGNVLVLTNVSVTFDYLKHIFLSWQVFFVFFYCAKWVCLVFWEHQMLFMNQCTHTGICVCMPCALKMITPIWIWINAGGNLILGHILLHNITNFQFRAEYLSYKHTSLQIRKNKSSIYTAHSKLSEYIPQFTDKTICSVYFHLEGEPQSHS